ncbi:MAG: class I SAM-dependent methyltransferase, partial [Verrucomicrobiota bacterium]
ANCGAALTPAFFSTDLNRGVGSEQFEYIKCRGCGAYELANVPADLSPYYPESYYELPPGSALPELAPNEAHQVEMVAPWQSSGKLVEVGPGAGVFSSCARQAGFDVTAIEMDARTCQYMREVVGVEAIESDDPAAMLRSLAPVSVVALWHVIEHLRDPWGFIDAAGESLASGGVLALAAPNPQSMQFRLLGSRWAHVDAPRHLFLIPLAAIAERAAKSGLRLAFSTTGDPSGRHWNRFGWEMAMRGSRRTGPPGPLVAAASLGAALALRPLETTGLRGAAYSAVFVKDG